MVAELLIEKDGPSYQQGSSASCWVVSLLGPPTGGPLSGHPACPDMEPGRPLRHREGISGATGWASLQHTVCERSQKSSILSEMSFHIMWIMPK